MWSFNPLPWRLLLQPQHTLKWFQGLLTHIPLIRIIFTYCSLIGTRSSRSVSAAAEFRYYSHVECNWSLISMMTLKLPLCRANWDPNLHSFIVCYYQFVEGLIQVGAWHIPLLQYSSIIIIILQLSMAGKHICSCSDQWSPRPINFNCQLALIC